MKVKLAIDPEAEQKIILFCFSVVSVASVVASLVS